MFEFDIEEFKDGLEGMSIQEQLNELDALIDNLATAQAEAERARDELIEDYEMSVYAPLIASVKSLVGEKKWEDKVTINLINPINIIVNTGPHAVVLYAIWDTDYWTIHVSLYDPITDDAKRHKALSDIASVIGLPYREGNEEISVAVEEDELQATMRGIITNLCEASQV